MKFFLSVWMLLFFSLSVYSENTLLQTSTGFYYPGNMKHEDSVYLGFGDKNKNYGYKCHLANDYKLAVGSPIYSVGSGVVKKASLSVGNYGGDGTTAAVGGAMVIEHKTSDGTIFYALYGHLKNLKYKEGDSVEAGKHIGDVRSYYSNGTPLPHLHFGINTNIPTYRGYTPTSQCNDYQGYVDPEPFLEIHSPSISTSSKSSGIFDGAGSLVNPVQNCFGCNKDVAVMHPHSGTGSTVVFQWLYNGSECDFLDLTADKNIDVIIKSKNWSKHLTQNAFKTTLSSSPVSLKKADGSWTTFAITSTSSISNETEITARCRKPNNTFHNGSTQSVAKDLVDVTYGYYWTGTGSIISQANSVGFGVEYDVATTFSTKKSLTSFQWNTSSACNKLKIQGESTFYNNASVSIKGWSNKDFKEVCTTLPCTIPKSADNYYYVIKIKSDANEFGGGRIRASCE